MSFEGVRELDEHLDFGGARSGQPVVEDAFGLGLGGLLPDLPQVFLEVCTFR